MLVFTYILLTIPTYPSPQTNTDSNITPSLYTSLIKPSCYGSKPLMKRSKHDFLLYMCTILILRSSDCETNPGPRPPKYPCQICQKACKWGQAAIACDNCDLWYHTQCMNMNSQVYKYHAKPDASWICCACGLPNYSSSFFTLSSSSCLSSNSFSLLNSSNDREHEGNLGCPLFTSSPKKNIPVTNPNHHRYKIISLNLQSLRAKKVSLHNLVNSSQPDIIVGTETWLKSDVHNSEFCPPGYSVRSRRDRPDGYGGVIIMTKSTIPADEIYVSNDSELTAIAVKRGNKSPLIIVGLYRPPSSNQVYADQVCSEIRSIADTHRNTPMCITGDFNLPDIDWSKLSTYGNSNPLSVNQAFISTFTDCGLQQMVDFPTRRGAILDLFITNRPSLINKIRPLPGVSDHEVLFIDTNVEVKHQRPPKRKIYLWNRANT
ncbi:hypothetical protein FSP39_021936 [Pinctada imbricata]|uniref:PHD-type domain-containing protein n=1 Tax=Pinctada imbricata TaxID=66713 RepID=A0AA88YST0_PINIB|nr:hypothetical protein FSP39_021936 [Pinctada imbricata]